MSFETALRVTEVLMALCFLQQGAEHMTGLPRERRLFALRSLLCLPLLAGTGTAWALPALLGVSLLILARFRGPYNGGSDRMGLLMLTCLCAARLAPGPTLAETAFAYLAVQLVLSYVVSGQVKVVNPDWRRGVVLVDVFRFSAYPVSESLRGWADRPRLLLAMSWAVMGLELAFPLSLLHPVALACALVLTAAFHLGNACLFGLNRFFWIWLAAYPSLLWFQQRVFG
ncbi:HTTM domain-containing protein (plasmid) [Paroceanicella profunda]|uniref:HTTM domain-containing protein n=1 Tax=Paroceanicella profunda TaxID=2579971 RepID=A0A5B8FK25_9RHOB|nr:HTTM domain-containing protein [Paroceanicella profunda]QDL94978.1 HTTM domain-containing protein [Paroceanicella profunda]